MHLWSIPHALLFCIHARPFLMLSMHSFMSFCHRMGKFFRPRLARARRRRDFCPEPFHKQLQRIGDAWKNGLEWLLVCLRDYIFYFFYFIFIFSLKIDFGVRIHIRIPAATSKAIEFSVRLRIWVRLGIFGHCSHISRNVRIYSQ